MVLPVAGAEVLLLADGFAGMAAGAAALPAAVAGAVVVLRLPQAGWWWPQMHRPLAQLMPP